MIGLHHAFQSCATALTFLQLGSIKAGPEYGLIMGGVLLVVNLVYVVSVVWQMIRLVNWREVWAIVERICTKLNCSHSCINGLAILSLVRGSEKQARAAMASHPQQRITPASECSV